MLDFKTIEKQIINLYSESLEYNALYSDLDFRDYQEDYSEYFSFLNDNINDEFAIGTLLIFMAYINDYLQGSGYAILKLRNFSKYLDEFKKDISVSRNIKERSQILINIILAELFLLKDCIIAKGDSFYCFKELELFLSAYDRINSEIQKYFNFDDNAQLVFDEYIKNSKLLPPK